MADPNGLKVNAYDGPIVCVMQADRRAVEPATNRVTEFAQNCGVEIDGLAQVLDELLADALQHANACKSAEWISCSLRRVNAVLLRITVRHGRTGPVPGQYPEPDAGDAGHPWKDVRMLVKKSGAECQFHESGNRVVVT